MAVIAGALIKWLKPSEELNYSALVENVDYQILNRNNCPRIDGQPVVGLEPNTEWMANYEPYKTMDYDPRVYIPVKHETPTVIAHPSYPNYHQFLITYTYERRSNEDIVTAIKAKMSDANASLITQSDRDMLNVITINSGYNLADGKQLTPEEITAKNRLQEVNCKMQKNIAHAQSLIDVVNDGGTPDINALATTDNEIGWIYNNLTPCGFPFSK